MTAPALPAPRTSARTLMAHLDEDLAGLERARSLLAEGERTAGTSPREAF